MNNKEMLFLGYKISYWAELQKKAKELNVVNYVQEISDLKGKLSFIESRLNEINTLLKNETIH